MGKFEVGDRVRVIKDGLSTKGAVGMLGFVRSVDLPCDEYPVRVEMDAGGSYESAAVPGSYRWSYFSEDALELAAVAPPAPPQVGNDVLIFGTIAGITHSPRGTNYNIVFETQNRRMSLHFIEEDFIVVDDEDGGCTRDNDNGPLPYSGDTAKAFDALGTWLRSLAVQRAA